MHSSQIESNSSNLANILFRVSRIFAGHWFTVKSLTSFCRIFIKPSFFQDILCWIVVLIHRHMQLVNLLLTTHNVILYCPKTVVLWDQISFPPLKAPIANWILPFLGLFHSVSFDLIVNDSSKVSKMFLYCSSFSAFVLLFSFKNSDELTVYIGSSLMINAWLMFVSCCWLYWNFYIQNLLFHERMVNSILRTVLVMITVFFRCQSKFDYLW